jgi:hypothetical protein
MRRSDGQTTTAAVGRSNDNCGGQEEEAAVGRSMTAAFVSSPPHLSLDRRCCLLTAALPFDRRSCFLTAVVAF